MNNASGRSGLRDDAPTGRRDRQLLLRQSTLARYRHRLVWFWLRRTDPTTSDRQRHRHIRLQTRGETWRVPDGAWHCGRIDLQTFART